MDFKNILDLFWEFVDNLKGQNLQELAELLPNMGSGETLEKILKGRYAKYLPLLPVLLKLSREGLSGVLDNSEDIKNILSGISGDDNSILKDIDIASILKFLPLLAQLFRKKEKSAPPLLAQIARSAQTAEIPKTFYGNPLGAIAEIADKEIIYALNRHIGKNL